MENAQKIYPPAVIEQNKYYQLGKKTFLLFAFEYGVMSFVFFFLGVVMSAADNYAAEKLAEWTSLVSIYSTITFLLFIIWIITFCIGIGVAMLRYKTCTIMFDDSSFHLVTGIFAKDEISLPYRRIQSVDIEQSLFYRIFGVGHIVITTTTNFAQPSQVKDEINDLVIPTMDYPFARIVEETLTHRAEIEKMEVAPRSETF